MPYLWSTSYLSRHCLTLPPQDVKPTAWLTAMKRDTGFNLMQYDDVVPEEGFPKDIYLRSKHKSLPDFISARFFLLVSTRVRDIITSLEAIHQFSDGIRIRLKDGSDSSTEFHAMVIRGHLIGSIIVERSTAEPYPTARPGAVKLNPVGADNKLVLDKDVIAGRHLWRTPDYFDSEFMSEELRNALVAAKVSKLSYWYQPAEQR